MRIEPEDIDSLRPLIAETVRAVLGEIRAEDHQLGGKIGISEAEAAELLDVKPHVLRDCRLRGEIHARKVGKEFRYLRDDLVRFLKNSE